MTVGRRTILAPGGRSRSRLLSLLVRDLSRGDRLLERETRGLPARSTFGIIILLQ